MPNLFEQKFQFHSPAKVVFGAGAIKALRRELLLSGKGRALLVLDQGLADTELAARIKQVLKESLAAVYDRVAPESSVAIVESGARLYRESNAESIVSVGGGSSIDTGKAIQAIIASDAGIFDEVRPGFWKKPFPFHLAAPTTAGTGSEVTSMSIIRDQSKGVKRLLMDPRLIPNTALLDPELTVSLPPTVTASSGVDAFSHAIEAMLSLGANPVSDLFAKESIKLLYENVPAAVADGSGLPARSGNLLAATLAGIAFQNALVGVVHALAHGLGGKFGIGHGLAIAICLPVGLEYNLEPSRGKIMEIGGLIIPGAGSAEKVIEGIRGWLDKIGLSRKLSELGAGREDLAQAAELAMKDPAILTNPRKPASTAELLELLKKVY